MSNHEMLWWQAYASLKPLTTDRLDVSEARIVGALAGKKAQDMMIDWFTKDNDQDYKKQEDAKILAEIQELKRQRELGNVKAN